jgi:hypothetical protein
MPSPKRRVILTLSAGFLAIACGQGERPQEPPAAPRPLPAEIEPPPPPAHPGQAYSTVDDPATMQALEEGGASLSDLISDAWMAPIRERLEAQVRAIARADSKAGVGIRGNSHRLFNTRWLRDGHFELIGLTYRAERIPVDPTHCGDVRLVYRLAYRTQVSGEEVHSRLPMTLLVELAPRAADASGCATEALRWMNTETLQSTRLAEFLLSGPLHDRLRPAQVTQVLVNAQIVRWPSAVRPSLGGHAEYSMLAFEPGGDRGSLVTKKLENMPDLAALEKDKAKRAELLQWVGNNLPAIDDGSAILPDAFLTSEALSVTPRGLSRRANRPFRQLFGASDFSSLALDDFRRIRSPEALLRRLDDLSCVGCHQSRTIAGFHWLGMDDDKVSPGNALYVSRSVPLWADARRRDAIIEALATGKKADFSRPFAERDDADPGIVGSRCGLGDPGFASWTCEEGLRCDVYDAPADDAVVGVCASAGKAGQGEACEVVAIAPHSNPHRDRAKRPSKRACAQGVCNINRTGFPGGMCTSSCADLPEDGACGVIALLTPFNNCLARKTPFPKCLKEHVSPAGLRACDAERPCRDDYVCARTPSGEGGCIPPYFLFQLRVDGHP